MLKKDNLVKTNRGLFRVMGEPVLQPDGSYLTNVKFLVPMEGKVREVKIDPKGCMGDQSIVEVDGEPLFKKRGKAKPKGLLMKKVKKGLNQKKPGPKVQKKLKRRC